MPRSITIKVKCNVCQNEYDGRREVSGNDPILGPRGLARFAPCCGTCGTNDIVIGVKLVEVRD